MVFGLLECPKMGAFDGKTVIVTGSSSGIGQAIAVTFAKEGAHVMIHGRDEKGVQVNSIHSQIILFRLQKTYSPKRRFPKSITIMFWVRWKARKLERS